MRNSDNADETSLPNPGVSTTLTHLVVRNFISSLLAQETVGSLKTNDVSDRR